MSITHRVRCSAVWPALVLLAGCGTSPPAPDAPRSTVPSSPAGAFAIASKLDVHVPAAAAPVIATLTAATDGPDDPARYLVDRMVATLSDGPIKAIASRAAPYVAAYLDARLMEIAPRFVAGITAIAAGLSRIATQVGTIETLQIDRGGSATRTIVGARFELGAAQTTVRFADSGLANIATSVAVALDATGQLAFSEHAHRLPYGAWLRLGLDRAVVAGVEPAARDLASALGILVDCNRLGALVADQVGLGSATLYATACRAGMTAIASEVDAYIAAIDDVPLGVAVTGAAAGIDLDGDGSMDEVRSGTWSGAVTSSGRRDPIVAASFVGTKTP